MAKNNNLAAAKRAKNDEFYTQRADIESELQHYAEHFRGKVVYCNCDDPKKSEFWKFFAQVFKPWGLKKLIATHYEPNEETLSYKMEMEYGYTEPAKHPLLSDGDFRSAPCIELLKKADIVVTNPPFSLFREYVAQLMEYKKKFLIIGNMNAITYKEIFPLIRDNQLWLGCRGLSKDMYFNVPDEYKCWLLENKKEGSAYKILNGTVMGRLASACWFTNLEHAKRYERMDLHDNYYIGYEDKYPTYDNYDAINVNKVADIPSDYSGVMGVPITFLDKYNPAQFEIIGCSDNGAVPEIYKLPHFKVHNEPYINGAKIYKRIFIVRRAVKPLLLGVENCQRKNNRGVIEKNGFILSEKSI